MVISEHRVRNEYTIYPQYFWGYLWKIRIFYWKSFAVPRKIPGAGNVWSRFSNMRMPFMSSEAS